MRVAILEYSGVATSSAADGTPATAEGTSSTPSSGNMTTTVNKDLILGVMTVSATATTTAGASFALQEQVPAPPSTKLIVEDRIQTTAGAVAATATFTASQAWAAGVAAFKQGTANIVGVSKIQGGVKLQGGATKQ
jgi:hypothetical protein